MQVGVRAGRLWLWRLVNAVPLRCGRGRAASEAPPLGLCCRLPAPAPADLRTTTTTTTRRRRRAAHNSWGAVRSVAAPGALTALHWTRAGAHREVLIAAAGRQVQVFEVHAEPAGLELQPVDARLEMPASVRQLASGTLGMSVAAVTDAPELQVCRLSVAGEWDKGMRVLTHPPAAPAGFLAMQD
jgi:hypothetical protein